MEENPTSAFAGVLAVDDVTGEPTEKRRSHPVEQEAKNHSGLRPSK